MRSTRHSVGLLMASIVLAGAARAATLVVRASGPSTASYPAGRMLPDSERIALKANDELVLLDADGTRTLRGPGTFAVLGTSSSAPSGVSALGAVVDQRSDRRVRIGAVRGVRDGPRRPSNIWFIDASRGGTICVPDARPTMLWRADADTAGSTVIAPAGGGSARLDWSAGETVQPWPPALPLTEGAHYSVSSGPTPPTAIRIARIGAEPDDLQSMAQTLIAHGCATQMSLLLATASAVEAAQAAGR